MNRKIIIFVFLAILIVVASFAYKNDFWGIDFFSFKKELKTQDIQNTDISTLHKTDAFLEGIKNDLLILEINGQTRKARINNSTQIFYYQTKSEETLAKELQESLESGGMPPSAGEYFQKSKEDLKAGMNLAIESQNDISQEGEIILFKVIIKGD